MSARFNRTATNAVAGGLGRFLLFLIFTKSRNSALTLFEQLIQIESIEFFEVAQKCIANNLGSSSRIAMGPTKRFRQYFVNKSEIIEAVCGYSHGFSGLLGFIGTLPEN